MNEPINTNEQDIIRFLTGEMNAGEAARFRKRLKKDPQLNRQVQETRETLSWTQEWLKTDAPGADRLEKIQIPKTILRRYELWRKAAVAAGFLLSFLIGSYAESKISFWKMDEARPSIAENTMPSESQETIAVVPTEKRTTPEIPTPTPEPASTPGRREKPILAYSEPSEYRREENGKIIIETQLRNMGTQAIWVIDGDFRLTETN